DNVERRFLRGIRKLDTRGLDAGHFEKTDLIVRRGRRARTWLASRITVCGLAFDARSAEINESAQIDVERAARALRAGGLFEGQIVTVLADSADEPGINHGWRDAAQLDRATTPKAF